jgi:hypothetical protein
MWAARAASNERVGVSHSVRAPQPARKNALRTVNLEILDNRICVRIHVVRLAVETEASRSRHRADPMLGHECAGALFGSHLLPRDPVSVADAPNDLIGRALQEDWK